MTKPLIIVWRITEWCNLNCHFCAYSKSLERPRRHASVEQVLRFGQLLADYRAQTQRPILVSWLGGEPFLWKPIEDVSRQFREQWDLGLSTTTNGTPLRHERFRRLAMECFEELTISIDGLGDFNDWCRDEQGLFADLKTNIKLLHQHKQATGKGPRLKVNTILMRGNIDHFDDFCARMHEWGIEELTFNQLGGYDRPEFFPANRLLPEQVDAFITAFPALQQRWAAAGLRIYGSPQYLHRFVCSSRNLALPIEDCGPGEWFLFLNEDGQISPCSFTVKDYGLSVDAVRSIADLEGLPDYFKGLRQEKRSVWCGDCHSTQVFEKFAVV